jgi:hypothetical protein
MGKYDDIRPEHLSDALVRFARAVLKLEEEGTLLERGPELQKMMGDLRRMLFAYEVRSTANWEFEDEDADAVEADPVIAESLRIVQEAVEQESKLEDVWRERKPPGESDEP